MSELVTIEELREQAAAIGLKNADVARYCIEQQGFAREERARERELEKLKLSSQVELEKLKLEHSERDKAREHELLILQAGGPTSGSSSVSVAALADRPKLPQLRDGDDITSFFIRFERIAQLLNLDANSYAVRVGGLLSGKALSVYASLSDDITREYDSLKKALLTSFNKTPEGYRRDFRSAKISSDETYEQFACHLGRLLDFWLKSLEIPVSYEGIRNFIITDQYLSSLSPELRLYLKERNPRTLNELTTLADNWASAHRSYAVVPKRPSVGTTETRSEPFRSRSSPQRKETSFPNRSVGVPGQAVKPLTCYTCGLTGHKKSRCPRNLQAAARIPPHDIPNHNVQFCFNDVASNEYMTSGTVNGSQVSTILRDTGCSCVIVSEEVLPNTNVGNCKKVKICDFLGRESVFPLVKCYIRCPFFEGFIDVVRAPIKFCSVLLGNAPGVSNHKNVDTSGKKLDVVEREGGANLETVQAVSTRSHAKGHGSVQPLVLPQGTGKIISPEEFANLQRSCPTLAKIRESVRTKRVDLLKDGSEFEFVELNGFICRRCKGSNKKHAIGKTSLVVPRVCRETVLQLAHESPLAGHFSHRKTDMKIRDNFFWPGSAADIRNFCRSCDRCQRMGHKGRVKPVPMCQIPVFTEPFARVSIDIVGPLTPASTEGHKYILTLIDNATGFPEAIPLKQIDSVSVSEALLQIFSRVGIPRQILSDNAPNFTSALMGELHRLLGVKPLFSTPYHPEGNSRVERLHGTLKAVLRKLCADKPRDWHRYLIPTMFALRELPSDRTGFSSFELLYGRQVRGPLTVLRDLWEDSSLDCEEREIHQYVLELREKLEECAGIAANSAENSSQRSKTYFDLKSQDRKFSVGDEVLVLLPDSKKKLLMSYSGPHTVLQRKNRVTYLIDQSGVTRLYHANLLKKYYRRATANMANVTDEVSTLSTYGGGGVLMVAQALLVDESDQFLESIAELDLPDPLETRSTENTLNVAGNLSDQKQRDVRRLLSSYADVMSETPGLTQTITHDIRLESTEPVKSKVYPVPVHLHSHFENEVDNLLKLGIIKTSSSPYCSPVILVRKPDSTYRMAIDYRKLNNITIFDSEPPCNVEGDLHRFYGCKFFSELDLCKAYYQVPLAESARPYTAFATHKGLMEFTRLPFGLATACATYIRLMRRVLANISGVSFYFDNVFIFSKEWPDHVKTLSIVLQRLRQHGLTARPAKCKFGYESLQYLGFVISGESLKPQQSKVDAILQVPLPKTKKCLRSFLGMVSFYRKFVGNLATLSAPLSDLLRKESREPLQFSEEQENNFNLVKQCLAAEPVLKLPNTNLPFVLRTDASGTGVGAVLLQYYDGCSFPVAYASRKLSDSEKRLSTIERECLAILFGINKFNYYLAGREFLLEVDHKPLVYLNSFKGQNTRLLRWALYLQSYKFRVMYIKGQDNIGADLLSRSFE